MRDRGSATAEWALVLPAVVLVLGVVLTAVAAMVEQARLDNVATDAARLASLGASTGAVSSHASGVFGAPVVVTIDSATTPHTVCVTVGRFLPAGVFSFEQLALSGHACALYPPHP